MPKKILVRLLFLVFTLSIIFPAVTGLWVKEELSRRLKIKIEGSWTPVFFQPAFELRGIHFMWDDKVKLLSGDLTVRYDLFSFFRSRSLRVKLSSSNLEAELLGEWAQQEGVSQVKFQHFFADLKFGKKGLEEVLVLEVKSPTIDLHFQNTEEFPHR